MKFLHMADIHLGCRRYNVDERTTDFFRAWYDVIETYAIPNKVDFLLIAGDFFDVRKVDPQAMNQAMVGLGRLKDAAIPVIAIEGNHDQHEVMSDHSWMRSLSSWGFLKLLEPRRDKQGRLAMLPWDEEEKAGSYIDIAGARIFGSHWYGASANAAIPVLSDALRRASKEGLFNILMLHTDVEGQLNRPIPALTIANLKELKRLTGYIALGHTHKKFEVDNWAFNPGSLEAVKIDEYKEERGVYLVSVDEQHRITASHLRDYVQRPFQRISFDVSGEIDAATVYAGVLEQVGREVRKYEPDSGKPAPIIELSLKGHLGFKNSLLPLTSIREEIQKRSGALHVIIRNQSVPVEYAVGLGLDIQAPRHEREQRIIEDLIARDNRYKHRARQMAELIIEAKKRALENESPQMIFDLISQKLILRATGGREEEQPAEAIADAESSVRPHYKAREALGRHAGLFDEIDGREEVVVLTHKRSGS